MQTFTPEPSPWELCLIREFLEVRLELLRRVCCFLFFLYYLQTFDLLECEAHYAAVLALVLEVDCLLVGTSAGGSFVQLYGRRYPDEVVGVVSMNAVPPADEWMDRALPLFTKEEREAERAFYRGENLEHIDWFTSNKEFEKAPAPPPVPFEVIISTKVQCEGEPPPCIKSYDVYEDIEREIAQEEWPEGSYRQVEYGHVIFLEWQPVAVNAVKRVVSKGQG